MAAGLYEYVGPSEFLEAARIGGGGDPLCVPADLGDRLGSIPDEDGIVTFVVDRGGRLRVGPRRSEHVSLAGGEPVRAAGELRLERRAEGWVATDVSNQSTGYCPDSSCWYAVSAALDALEVARPDGWTSVFQFRRARTAARSMSSRTTGSSAASARPTFRNRGVPAQGALRPRTTLQGRDAIGSGQAVARSHRRLLER